MSATPLNERALAPSTDRCLAILEALSAHPAGLTLSDMHRLLGVSKNMAFRILSDMTARGFVYRDADKTYFLGGKLLELAAPRVSGRNLVDEAAPLMRELRDGCRESVGLLVPNGGEAVLIYFQPALHPMRLIFDLGFRVALYCNAPGKVFLAFGEPAELRQRWQLQSFERRTDHTITDPNRLQAELERARRDGYTLDRGEDIEGAHCAGAPVFDRDERVVASLVIAGPSQRLPLKALPELGKQVAAAAGRLSSRLRV
jgi:IclR family acetate operon transcriptional repressor